jgi:preprotein translocase subunit SecA
MINSILKKMVGTKNERDIKRLWPTVHRVGDLETAISELSDEQLRAKTGEFKERLERGEALDDLLPEAFAVVREVSKRVLGMRHFDVQIMGGMVLHQGKIAEMKTGEGKTLVATLPVYLNGLLGKGVHVVTVNDYLAKRDSHWMGGIYRFLGLSVGIIQHEMDDAERKRAYTADVTYGTNNEFGFDYLRDNMKFSLEDYVQRTMHYAIVDEVDSILIDEARTPLIISGPAEESTEKYYQIDRIIPRLKRDQDYQVDEKAKTASLTEEGIAKAERFLGVENLYDPSQMEILHHIHQALKAHALFKNDVDYVVKDGEVIIVDEFTGRLMPGRRYSDGLHQALEAKEKVKIERENQTLASITFQNYFRMYEKLAGMTGTADTEAAEFSTIYSLDVVVIPTNCSLIRYTFPDLIYKTEREKFEAVVEDIGQRYATGQPVLVGTISIEKSERLSQMLKRGGIPHHVLNAKHHEREAEIVAQAGRKGAVTIATNMAGRGTDILLGGNPEFLALDLLRRKEIDPREAAPEQFKQAVEEMRKITQAEHEEVVGQGGLHVLGTERHEARRIDNQLRGRAGRQGDPGSSQFYLSLEDDLLRLFGSDRLARIMDKLGMEEGQPIEHKMVNRAIETAQARVEAHNFEIRKHLLEYDDVMNNQRKVIYEQRRMILGGENLRDHTLDTIEEVVDRVVDLYTNEDVHPEEWDLNGLREVLLSQFGLDLALEADQVSRLKQEVLREKIHEGVVQAYEKKEAELGEGVMRQLETMIMLQVLDNQWKDHLYSMDHLKEGIGLRGYGQKDPLIEYKREGYDMFSAMVERIESESLQYLFRVQLQPAEREMAAPAPRAEPSRPQGKRSGMKGQVSSSTATSVLEGGGSGSRKIGRNEPCVCGSGKKYKKCCGK